MRSIYYGLVLGLFLITATSYAILPDEELPPKPKAEKPAAKPKPKAPVNGARDKAAWFGRARIMEGSQRQQRYSLLRSLFETLSGRRVRGHRPIEIGAVA